MSAIIDSIILLITLILINILFWLDFIDNNTLANCLMLYVGFSVLITRKEEISKKGERK